MTGKITVGLTLHWPHVADISGSPPMGSKPRRGRRAPAYTLSWSMVLYFFNVFVRKLCTKKLSISVDFHSYSKKTKRKIRGRFGTHCKRNEH